LDLQLGPFRFNGNIGLGAGYEWSDNENQSEDDPEAQGEWTLDFGPVGTATLMLPFRSQGVTLSITTSGTASYKYSYEDDEWEFEFGSPVSVVATLPFYIRGWTVTAANSFSLVNEPLERAVKPEEQDSIEYNNNASITASRPFGRLGVSASVSRSDTWAPDEPFTEETIHQFNFTPTLQITEYHSLYWSHTVGMTTPEDPDRAETIGYSTTVGVSGRLTQTLTGNVGLGYTWVYLDEVSGGATNKPSEVISGLNAVMALAFAHPLRPNTTHSLSFAYFPGVTALMDDSDVQESYTATYSLTHRLNRNAVIAPTVSWNFIRDVGSVGSGEATHLVRAGFTFSSPVLATINSTFSYFFETRDSNLTAENYDSHLVNLGLSWQLPKRWTPQFTYTYEKQNSKVEGDSFAENVLKFSISYTF
jgi:hypothetical protein